MIKHVFIITIAALGLTFQACKSSPKIRVNTNQNSSEVVSFSSQDVYPGVYSNLMKTRTYRLVFDVTVAEPHTIEAMLIDSVRLPVSYLRINQQHASPTADFTGAYKGMDVTFSRHFYQEYAPDMVAEEIPVLSGLQLGDSAVLVLKGPNGLWHMKLGVPAKSENIYAP